MSRHPHVNTVQAKNEFNALVTEVNRTKEPVIIEKRGKPVAVIVDFTTYHENNQVDKKSQQDNFFKELLAHHEQMKADNPNWESCDSVELIREMREERAQHLYNLSQNQKDDKK